MARRNGLLVLVVTCVVACGPSPDASKPSGMPKPIEVTPDYITFYSPEEPRMFDDYTHRIAGVASEHCEKDGRNAVYHSYDAATGTVKWECIRYVDGKRVS